MMIVPIVVGYNFSMIYIDSGPLNQILSPFLQQFGIDPRIRWLSHPIAAQLLIGSVDLGLTTGAVTVSDDFGSINDAVTDVINLGTVP